MRDDWIEYCHRDPIPCEPDAVIDVMICDMSVFEAVEAGRQLWECDYCSCVFKWRYSKKELGKGDYY